ncbi:hypothetical protein D3C73_1379670 [compost metagenome]
MHHSTVLTREGTNSFLIRSIADFSSAFNPEENPGLSASPAVSNSRYLRNREAKNSTARPAPPYRTIHLLAAPMPKNKPDRNKGGRVLRRDSL